IMGCATSASVTHDDLEDASLTRVVFTDAAGRELVEHSAPFKEGLRRFNSMRISDGDASAFGINVPLASTHNRHVRRLDKFLAEVEQNPRMLEKRVRQRPLLKVAKEISEQSMSDVSTDVSNFASSPAEQEMICFR
ncbi:unnamed protein product, partial [Symbiodinium sp. CCMP2456]